MLMVSPPTALTLQIGSAQFHAQNVQIGPTLTLDEVDLEGEEIQLEPAGSEQAHIFANEVRFRAMISEPNLNRLLESNLPKEAPVRNLRVALLSGKARITGQRVVLGLGVPFAADAAVHIENGVRAFLDFQDMNAAGVGLPASVVEVIEQQLNQTLTLDMTKLPIPVWLEEARCEPGRLTIRGKARIASPPLAATAPVLPFTAHELLE